MKKFTLDGEVGWEISTDVVKAILYKANGEDITVDFSSPGGSVYAGIKIFNMFKNYSGKVTFNIIGLAASMGSYIPLAGDTITAEANAVYMIHEPRMFTGGTQKDFRKAAVFLSGLTSLMAKEYVKKTGMSAEVIAKMLDEETYLFGSEILEAGFVDSVNGEEDVDPDAKTISFATAKESFNASMKKLRDEMPDDYEQVAALLPQNESMAGSLLTDIIPVDNSRDNHTTEVKKVMNIEKLKAEYPEIAAALIAQGVTKERDRVNAHLVLGNASGDTKTAFEAIESGSEMTATIQAKYMAAGMNKRDVNDRLDDTDTANAADNSEVTPDTGTEADTVAALVEKKFGIVKE